LAISTIERSDLTASLECGDIVDDFSRTKSGKKPM